ncbi:hypothetical protein K523DRAFT_322839 [Schizophyllum commune Tattone D]|nr:hypothetical protein K523DRAFT_322839 [Schizophyllum commune Tattone D]
MSSPPFRASPATIAPCLSTPSSALDRHPLSTTSLRPFALDDAILDNATLLDDAPDASDIALLTPFNALVTPHAPRAVAHIECRWYIHQYIR